jgi:hypothetical protein
VSGEPCLCFCTLFKICFSSVAHFSSFSFYSSSFAIVMIVIGYFWILRRFRAQTNVCTHLTHTIHFKIIIQSDYLIIDMMYRSDVRVHSFWLWTFPRKASLDGPMWIKLVQVALFSCFFFVCGGCNFCCVFVNLLWVLNLIEIKQTSNWSNACHFSTTLIWLVSNPVFGAPNAVLMLHNFQFIPSVDDSLQLLLSLEIQNQTNHQCVHLLSS